MRMRTMIGALLLALLPQTSAAISVGDEFPDVAVNHVRTGQPLVLRGGGAKLTLVNLWATWCEACKVEIMEMADLFAPLLHRGDVQIAWVTLDKDPQKAVAWLRDHIKAPEPLLSRLYADPQFHLADRLAIDSFPATLLVRGDGRVVYIQSGFKAGEGSTRALLDMTRKELGAAQPNKS